MSNLQTQLNSNAQPRLQPTSLQAVDLQRVAPQTSAANPGAVGKGIATAGVPVSPLVGTIVGVKQTLVDVGLIDPETERAAYCTQIEDATVETSNTNGDSGDQPVSENLVMLNSEMMTRSLLQNLNNHTKKNQETTQTVAVDNSEDSNGFPAGTYSLLSRSMSIVASVLMQVNGTVSQNSAKIAELNTIMGTNAEALYQSQLNQQIENLNKQEQAQGAAGVFARIGHIGAYIGAAAMILVGCITMDPALIAVGIIMLAMANPHVSSHVTDGLAKGLGQIPGMGPEAAKITAEVLVGAAMIAACVLTGNAAGAEAEVTEAVEEASTTIDEFSSTGSEIDLEAESESSSSFETIDAPLDTAGGMDPEALRIQGQMEAGQIQAAEESLSETLSQGMETLKSFLVNFGSNPEVYNFIKAMSITSGVLQAAAGIGVGVEEGRMASLTENYAVLQANATMLQGILDSISMRNQENVSVMKSVTQANYKEIGQMYSGASQSISTVAQAMYHV